MFSQRTNESNSLFILRWSARLLSALTIAFILLFMFGSEANWSAVAVRDLIGLLFFPFGLMLGLVLGWRREMAGGLIGVGSMALFFLVYGLVVNRAVFMGWWFVVLSVPAVLFLAYGLARHEHWNGEFDIPAAAGK
ncbi:MAG TPA: hypothetical protein VL501_08590 [Pyrinomonadaceae bacterium]|nr:hypothetical protein [Pyrinomonadaceae bacterium]